MSTQIQARMVSVCDEVSADWWERHGEEHPGKAVQWWTCQGRLRNLICWIE